MARHYVQAIQRAGVPQVVQLSSWGADLDHGTILAPHDAERILAAVPGVASRHLHPTTFYANYYGFLGLGMIKSAGFLGANCAGSYRSPLVHPLDIAAAAEELGRAAAGRYVASNELIPDEITHALSTTIGRPDLRWVGLSDEQMLATLVNNGLPIGATTDLVELCISLRTGKLGQDYKHHKPTLDKAKLEELAHAFAFGFNDND
jgi:uncharacterized protein YbjT (DUF2867 family)